MDTDEDLNDNVAVQESKPKLKKPPLYKVILVNDDFTPMEFVVEVLQQFFHFTHEKAISTMLDVHTNGRGLCGIFTYEIAETKVSLVTQHAREYQHPLLCTMEEA